MIQEDNSVPLLSDFLPAKTSHCDNIIMTNNSNMKYPSKSSNINSPENSDDENIYTKSNSISKRKYFSHEEDNLLMNAVMKYKQESWNDIAQYVPGRTPKQCRDRWVNYLQPSLNFEPWSNSEDLLLVSLVNKYGTHWAKMKPYFHERSLSSIKNRWYLLIKSKVKVLPIDKMIASYMESFSKSLIPVKSSNHTDFLNIIKKNDIFNINENMINPNLIALSSQITVSDNNSNHKYYFLVEKESNKNDSSKLNNLDLKFDNGSYEEEELITFTPEELEW